MEVVAVYIKVAQQKYLMQLRDNNPEIAYPMNWGLFGGVIEDDEGISDAAIREIYEEIGILVYETELYNFGKYNQDKVKVNTCFYDLKESYDIKLNEGADFGIFSINEILQGGLLSSKYNQIYEVAEPLIKEFSKLLYE